MYEYINDAIARESAYAEGYEAGKQAAAKQIFEDLDKILSFTSFHIACISAGRFRELKKKYGVK